MKLIINHYKQERVSKARECQRALQKKKSNSKSKNDLSSKGIYRPFNNL